MINLSHFRKGDARGRLIHVLNKTGRLVLRRRGDDRYLRVLMRGGVPDTLHIDRAVAPTVPINDDRCLVAERQDERAIPRR